MIIFRTAAGPQLGFGHLIRCRALARTLRERGHRCVMVGPSVSEMESEDSELFDAWHTMPSGQSNELDAKSVIEIAHRHQSKWVILDDFRVDEAYQLTLFKGSLKTVLFNVRSDQPIWADIAVSTHLSFREEMFAPQIRNSQSRLLIGPDYAILRPVFQNIKARPPAPLVEKVLLIFGGGDDRGAIKFSLESILPASEESHKLFVVSSAANPRNDIISEWVGQHGEGRVFLSINPAPSDMAALFTSCDMAIIAGGTTAYEVAFCGVPMIVMPIVDNQIFHAQGFAEHGAMLVSGFPSDEAKNDLCAAFQLLKNDHVFRQKLAKRMRQLVDGKGVDRIANVISAALN